LVLGQPYAGRTIPFAFVCYSEKTINQGLNSRNLEHQRLFRQVKDLWVASRVLDLSYLGLFEAWRPRGSRLNGAHRPTITDEEGRRVALFIRPGQKVLRRNVIYLGKVKGNLAGYWAPGLEEPVWDLEPEKALEIYRSRMKIEQSFRDLKGLLGLEKVMSKKLENLEKLIAFWLMRWACLSGRPSETRSTGEKKHQAYSGLFILLKHRLRLRLRQFLRLIRLALDRFRAIVQGPVLSPA
jgi:hypothetical protein